jgi:hypothetical protein
MGQGTGTSTERARIERLLKLSRSVLTESNHHFVLECRTLSIAQATLGAMERRSTYCPYVSQPPQRDGVKREVSKFKETK